MNTQIFYSHVRLDLFCVCLPHQSAYKEKRTLVLSDPPSREINMLEALCTAQHELYALNCFIHSV